MTRGDAFEETVAASVQHLHDADARGAPVLTCGSAVNGLGPRSDMNT